MLLLPLRNRWSEGGMLVASEKRSKGPTYSHPYEEKDRHQTLEEKSRFSIFLKKKKLDMKNYMRYACTLTSNHLIEEKTLVGRMKIRGGLLVKRLTEFITVEEVYR